uniref:Regulatory protein E2 n=1 Tax=Human papillomavirus TaxID=10566 RepID=A0A385PPC1_9PAPI|nr:MAG: E2 protein [Human papillomavirus]
MEALNQRFNVLQDQLMDIYERGSDTLEEQIKHWTLLKQEQIILNYARRRGIMRLGYHPVPTLAVSELKAKDAIAMVLHLENLKQSPYKDEPWTLINTSLETFRSPPTNCFKKGPQNVEVLFDGDPENVMLYTAWKFIYYEDTEGQWQKTEGHIDYAGLYYVEGGIKHYYVEFNVDAQRFGTRGEWEVRFNGETLFAPVTSSSPSPLEEIGERPKSPDVPETTTDTGTLQRETRHTERPESTLPKGRRYERKESSPTSTSLRGRQKVSGHTSRKKESRRSRSTSSGRLGTDQAAARGRGQRQARPRTRSRSRRRSRSRSKGGRRTTAESRRGRCGGRGYVTRSRSRSAESRSTDQCGILPSQVGTGVQSVGRKYSSRVERLLAEAVDPPVILIRGPPNTLKCYRYREKERLKGFYDRFSTTWSWVGSEGNARLGRARMLICFLNEEQRERFIDKMRLPKGVDWSYGNFASI